MDRLSGISFTLFLIADCFAIAALCMPDWIVTNVGGKQGLSNILAFWHFIWHFTGSTRIGLLRSCMTIRNKPTECFTQSLTVEWAFSLIFIFLGCVCLTTALAVTIISQWERGVERYSRWAGFFAVIFFCLAAILFPVGFSINEIGGAPFQVSLILQNYLLVNSKTIFLQLPNNYTVGISYIFFVMAIWITVISELFATKICLPHF